MLQQHLHPFLPRQGQRAVEPMPLESQYAHKVVDAQEPAAGLEQSMDGLHASALIAHAVHRLAGDDAVEAPIRRVEFPHICLSELHIPAGLPSLFPRLLDTVLRVVETGRVDTRH